MVWLSTRFNLTLRWLLRLDQPVVPRTNDEIEAEVAQNYRWNFSVNMLDVITFWFGNSFISAATILPLFVSKLTDSTIPLALVAIIGQASWFLPQLFTANGTESLARKKPVVVNIGLFLERLPVWLLLIAAVAAWWSPILALILFFAGYALHGIGAGLVAPAWQDLLARCFPVTKRGRFFGTAMFIGAAMATAGAALSTRLLEVYPFPKNFVFLFSIASIGITISWAFLALTREPVQPIDTPRRSNRQFWASLPGIIRQDHNFRRFLVARMLLALGSMGVGFVTVAAIDRWQVPDSAAGLYTAAYLIGQTIGNLAFGFMADRYGHKLSLEISALASLLAFTVAWLAPSPIWYYLVFALLGVNIGAVIVSGVMVILEFCRPQRRPTYAGLANTAVGLVSIGAPLLGAALAGYNYSWLFGLGAAANLAAFIAMRWWVKEPRWAGVGNIED